MGEYRYYLVDGVNRTRFDSADDVRKELVRRDAHLGVFKNMVIQELNRISNYAERGVAMPAIARALGLIVYYAGKLDSVSSDVYVLRKMKDTLEVYELYDCTEDGLYDALADAAEYLGMDLEREYL